MKKFCPVLVLLFALSGCAVQKSQAPQIAPTTASALNFATLVSQSQKDYVQFFVDVGAAEKAGELSAAQVAALNTAGLKMRDALDAAGNLAQTYAATENAGIANEVSAYLEQAAEIYAALYSQRAGMIAQNAAAKATGGKSP